MTAWGPALSSPHSKGCSWCPLSEWLCGRGLCDGTQASFIKRKWPEGGRGPGGWVFSTVGGSQALEPPLLCWCPATSSSIVYSSLVRLCLVMKAPCRNQQQCHRESQEVPSQLSSDGHKAATPTTVTPSPNTCKATPKKGKATTTTHNTPSTSNPSQVKHPHRQQQETHTRCHCASSEAFGRPSPQSGVPQQGIGVCRPAAEKCAC